MSTINGDKDSYSPNKIGNFNEYQHVYTDLQSNEANVNWITKLRSSDSHSNLMSSTRLNTINGGSSPDHEKQSNITYE